MTPWLLVAAHRSTLTLLFAACTSGVMLAFILWRCWVVFRQGAAKRDEWYDREGKFDLASEYHETESATAASRKADQP